MLLVWGSNQAFSSCCRNNVDKRCSNAKTCEILLALFFPLRAIHFLHIGQCYRNLNRLKGNLMPRAAAALY
jgi:hypothetical protein